MLIRRTRWFTVSSLVLGCLILGFAALLTTADAASAQSTAPSGPFAGMSLTQGQQTQIRALTQANAQRQRAILSSLAPRQGPDSAQREALLRIANDHNDAVRRVLTPTQQLQLDANHRAFNDARLLARGRQAADSLRGH